MRASRRGEHAGQRRGGAAGTLRWWRRLVKDLSWWQALLVLAPLPLCAGGAVGGFLGVSAAAACATLTRRGWNAALRAMLMVCVDALAFVGYFVLASLIVGLLPKPAAPQAASAALSASAAAYSPKSCVTADRSGAAAVPLAAPSASPPPLPAGVQPVSAPMNSGTTSAHATEVLVRSGSGDDIGKGQSGDYTGTQVDVSGTTDYALIDAGTYRIELESPGASFACGTYVGTTAFDDPRHIPGKTPVMSVTGNSSGCTDNGTFTIYQMAANSGGSLIQLNATFSHTCAGSSAPLVGVIRYHATTPTPVPALTSSAQPVTPAPDTGTTSAHADEFSVLSAPGDFVGDGQPFDYAGPALRVGGTLGAVNIGVAGWNVALSAPSGQQLAPGTYPAAAGPLSSAGPGISVSADGHGCDNDYGAFTIYQIAADAAGDITQLNATFSHRCESATAPPLVGFIRFNATTPTPVPVLPASAG